MEKLITKSGICVAEGENVFMVMYTVPATGLFMSGRHLSPTWCLMRRTIDTSHIAENPLPSLPQPTSQRNMQKSETVIPLNRFEVELTFSDRCHLSFVTVYRQHFSTPRRRQIQRHPALQRDFAIQVLTVERGRRPSVRRRAAANHIRVRHPPPLINVTRPLKPSEQGRTLVSKPCSPWNYVITGGPF